MSLILCIETTSKTSSVALSENGRCLGLQENTQEQYAHSENLSLFIEKLLNENQKVYSDLDAVCLSGGPGSYTGLRIGASTAKGICYGLEIPLIALSTLEIMSSEAIRIDSQFDLYCPMVDARRMEVFTSLYDRQMQVRMDSGPLILDESSFSAELKENKILFFGSGSKKFSEILRTPNAHFNFEFQNSARHNCILAEDSFKKQNFVDLAYYEPNYLKPFMATLPKSKLSQ